MCGIAGVVAGNGHAPVDREVLRSMVAVLRHRGPDGYGLYRDPHVGLAHARLAIVDPIGGDQPMTNEDGTIWLSCNGEIFNHVELRRELEARGHRFRSRSDSEVVVHAYEEFGEDAWRRFNGQFAFALWDRPARRLWLVRDRLGILPLHYAVADDKDQLVFASEAKAIFASGHVRPSFEPDGLMEVFGRWSVRAPSTVFQRVRSVRPGAAVCVDVLGNNPPPRLGVWTEVRGPHPLRVREQRWWNADLAVDPRVAGLSVDEAADALGERLTEAVRLRLRADVPVGAYLSGGLDSSVVAALVEQGDSPLETFAVRFADPRFDETAEQRRMAALLETTHHEILCDGNDIASALQDVVWHCETPLLRTAPVPLFLLSGLVRDLGFKVVLTGEGADELLAGYSIFKEDAIRRFWARQPEADWRGALAARLHPEVAAGSNVRDSQLWARFYRRDLEGTGHPFYAHLVRWQNTEWTRRVLAPGLRASSAVHLMYDPDGKAAGVDGELAGELPPGWDDWPPLARAQWTEIATFMSPYLLSCQGDRVAMAHGVEVRYPFLDPEVVRWCFSLPSRLKLTGLRDKLALRRLASRTLPTEIAQRPKQPYRAPMTGPLFGPAAPEYVTDLLSDDTVARLGLLAREPTRRLVDRARSLDGHLAGEREEMALVGALTLQTLAWQLREELPSRIRAARSRLDRVEPTVDVVVEAADAAAVGGRGGGA